MKTFSIIQILLISYLASCTGIETNTPLNPNGDSELALLMRQMYEDGELAKLSILEDEDLGSIINHESMLTATPTQPEKVQGKVFKTFADDYLKLINELNDPNNSDKKTTYRNMVNSCINCHKALCPGPIVKINKLKI